MRKGLINRKTIITLLYSGLLEGLLACILVVVLVWALTQIAIIRSETPKTVQIEPENDKITLSVYDALVTGDLILAPTTLENQLSNFDYMYGRQLLKERQSRYVRSWTDDNATLSWFIEVRASGIYQVEIEYLSDEYMGGTGEFVCDGQTLSFKSDLSAGSSVVKKEIGEIVIERKGRYRCTLSVKDISAESFIKFRCISIQAHGK